MSKNPRIYFAIESFHPLVGGAETQMLLLAHSLCQRGYEVTIVTFRHNSAWLSKETIEGVPVVRVAGILLGKREKLPRFLRQVCYLLALGIMGVMLWRSRRCYDILHVYQLNLIALPTALACKLTGKPMIIAVRSSGTDRRVASQNKVSLIAGPLVPTTSWLQVEDRNRIGGDLETLERLGKPVVRFTHSLLLNIHTVVIVLSSRMKNYLVAHDFILPNMRLIPNGVDTTRFQYICANSPSSKRTQVVVCVARLSYVKGIDVLLQAWHLVQLEYPQSRLIIVGTGPIRAQLEKLALALDLVDSVEFAGLQEDVPAQLQRGNIAVLPSRREGMPNAILEAMACGLPCVATRVSGSEDIIQHGVNGLLVEPEDYQSLAQALLTLLRDPELAQKYGRAARATVEQHYSFDHMIDAYIELYHKMTDL